MSVYLPGRDLVANIKHMSEETKEETATPTTQTDAPQTEGEETKQA